ncbi:NERD domain-containing protein [Streptomyces sp. SHP22-7]|nr:NERD domain-containing protein [Streptomyces sp. SHP22-7]
MLRWIGINTTNRRLEAAAVRQEQGSLGEQQTAILLSRLPAGWTVLHDLAVPGRRFNLDHVLIPPSGLGVVVLDSKKWRRSYQGRPCLTTLVGVGCTAGHRTGTSRSSGSPGTCRGLLPLSVCRRGC